MASASAPVWLPRSERPERRDSNCKSHYYSPARSAVRAIENNGTSNTIMNPPEQTSRTGEAVTIRPRSPRFLRRGSMLHLGLGSAAHSLLLAVTSPSKIHAHANPKDTPPRPTARSPVPRRPHRRLKMQASKATWICRALGARRKGESRRLYPSLTRGPIWAVRGVCTGRRVSTGRPSPCTYRG